MGQQESTNPFEAIRLQLLRSLEVLDTPKEEVFDRITQLAANLCGCPVAALSFADAHRHWCKSVYGISTDQCSRTDSFCDHMISEKSLLVVPDATQDEKFKNNRSVTDEPHVRFYAGQPLVAKGGLIIGTLCVVAYESRQLNDLQKQALEALARQAVQIIEMRSLEKTVAVQSELMTKMHQQLVQQSRLSAIGMMAGGIAHEVNNPLTVIIGRAQQVSRLMKTSAHPQKIDEAVEKIIETAKRVGQIVISMRNLARDDSTVAQTRCELHSLVQETMDLCRARFENHDVHLEWHPKDFEGRFVMVNPVHFGQVLLNLLSNAFDAVRGQKGEKSIQLRLKTENEKYHIDVVDSGPGIIVPNQSQVFKPFFTTKPLGEGTGLGLSLSKSMIEQNGGRLNFISNSPTTFRISLNRAQDVRLAA